MMIRMMMVDMGITMIVIDGGGDVRDSRLMAQETGCKRWRAGHARLQRLAGFDSWKYTGRCMGRGCMFGIGSAMMELRNTSRGCNDDK
jgi:hypothetical protein